MLTSKRFLLPAALFVVAVAFAFYTVQRSSSLEADLARARATTTEARDSLGEYVAVLAADSLIYTGDYRGALADYEDLLADTTTSLLAPHLRARIEHARQLIQLGRAMDTLRMAASRDLRPAQTIGPISAPAVERMPLERSNPNRYDSLTFALRKAEMRIRNLEGRLEHNTGDNYLTFDSQRGNTVWYVGDIDNGQANGRGVALLSSGSRYIGEWRDNRRHGVGEFYWSDGAYYEGEYEEDQRSGQGTYHFASGETFVGTWEDDVRNGAGVFYDAKGEVVASGVWEDDELVQQQ